MHAIRLHAFGDPDQLVLDELPDLEPAEGQVRIAVAAAGVHLVDTSLRRGEDGPMPRPPLPTVPGREVAGVVDAVGAEVADSWLGQRVVSHLGQVPGGYAEQAVTAVETLFPVPDQVGFADAVASVGTGRTAEGVLELEPPSADDVALVLSAAGGLGWLLAQDVRAVGATLVAAAGGPDRVAALAPLEADLAVDYRRQGWADQVRERFGGVTRVYDGVGGEVGRTSLELLRRGGRLVLYGYASGEPTSYDEDELVLRGVSAGWVLGAPMAGLPGGIPGLAARALAKVATGEWRPLVTTYPLAEAAHAHADLESRRVLGKAVLLTDSVEDAAVEA